MPPYKNNDDLSSALMAWQDSKTATHSAALWSLLFPFVERYVSAIFFAWRLNRSGNEVDDCVEEVVLHLLEKDVLETWDRAQAPASAYLRVVAFRRLHDLARRTDLLRIAERDEIELIEAPENPETLLIVATSRSELRAKLTSVLHPGELAIYDLLYEKGVSQAVAAATLGISEAAVAKRHERLKERARTMVVFARELGLLRSKKKSRV